MIGLPTLAWRCAVFELSRPLSLRSALLRTRSSTRPLTLEGQPLPRILRVLASVFSGRLGRFGRSGRVGLLGCFGFLSLVAVPAQAQAQWLELLASADIPSLQMALLDEGFLDAMIATAAEQNGVAPEDFRTLLVSQVQNFYLFLPQTAQGLAMSAGAEIAKFLEGGKTLSLSIAPEYGGNIKQLQEEIMGAVFTGDYNKVSEVLHLEITAQ